MKIIIFLVHYASMHTMTVYEYARIHIHILGMN